MNISEFLKKNPVNTQEREICKRIYSTFDLTEDAWKNKLKNSVTFLVPTAEEVFQKTEKAAQETEQVGEEKATPSKKNK